MACVGPENSTSNSVWPPIDNCWDCLILYSARMELCAAVVAAAQGSNIAFLYNLWFTCLKPRGRFLVGGLIQEVEVIQMCPLEGSGHLIKKQGIFILYGKFSRGSSMADVSLCESYLC